MKKIQGLQSVHGATLPKIKGIKESKHLASMSMEALFEKLFAEEIEKKRKGIALKVNFSKEDYKESSSDDKDAENLSLMVKKFGKFLRRSKGKKFSKPS